MRTALAGALAASLALGAADVRSALAGPVEAELLRLINRVRVTHDLGALKPRARLAQDAERHTRLMVRRGQLFDPDNLIELLKPYDWERVGASVVGCGGTSRALVRAWMHSDVHRSILLSPDVERIGIGAIRADGRSACGRDRLWATGILYG